MLHTAITALALLSAGFFFGIAVGGVRALNSTTGHRPPQQVRSLVLRGVAAGLAFVLLFIAARIGGGPDRELPAEVTAPPAAIHLEATVYLPLADNAGRTFPDDTWDRALAGLVTPFGGATLGEPQDGCWVDDGGRLVRERVRPVVISFRDDELDRLRGAVRQLRRELGQEAVYVRYEGARVELVR